MTAFVDVLGFLDRFCRHTGLFGSVGSTGLFGSIGSVYTLGSLVVLETSQI